MRNILQINKDTLKFKNTFRYFFGQKRYCLSIHYTHHPEFFDVLSQMQDTLINDSLICSYQVLQIIEYSRKAQTQSHE